MSNHWQKQCAEALLKLAIAVESDDMQIVSVQQYMMNGYKEVVIRIHEVRRTSPAEQWHAQQVIAQVVNDLRQLPTPLPKIDE